MNFISDNYRVNTQEVQNLVNTYGLAGAAKLLSEDMDTNIDNTYVAGVLYALSLQETSLDEKDLLKRYPTLFHDEERQFILDHYEELKSMLIPERDFGYKYASIHDIAANYLFKVEGKPVENLQWMWMRVAVQVAFPNMNEIAETYDILSKREGIHATPTCVNACFHIPQLESCFLVAVGDSMLSIADAHKLMAMGSKCNGGFGIDVGRIRHSRVANRGVTKGIPGVLRLFNTLIPYADQLGSRNAACTAYCPIWHCDIKTFLRMKDRNSPEAIQCTNLNYAVAIPDLFYQRVLTKGKWSLFCPRQTRLLWASLHGVDVKNSKAVDECPCLHDLTGSEFERFYVQCEEAGIAAETVDAATLHTEIHSIRATIGEPFIFNTDNVNRKTNHSHLGTVTQSNLCMEITQYTKPDEIAATCDLATVNVASLVRTENGVKSIDWKRLGEIVRQLTRNLNRVLDRTSGIIPNQGQRMLEQHFREYPEDRENPLFKKMYENVQKDPTYTARMQNRAIGIGAMGLASMFALLGIEFTSKEAAEIGTRIRAAIYWHSVDESVRLAQKEGAYPTFAGSPMSKGILQQDMWKSETQHMNRLIRELGVDIKRYDYPEVDPREFGVDDSWDNMRERVKAGVRNSLFTVQMPNATTSGAFGVSPSCEPFYEIMFTSSNINGTDKNIYDAFRDVLIEKGIYRPVEMAAYLKDHYGRVEGMHTLFPEGTIEREECVKIEPLFTPSFAINKKKYILMIQRMAYYIDQATSLNVFYDKPNAKYLAELSILAWVNGNKTEYYLRRLPPSEKISTQVGRLDEKKPAKKSQAEPTQEEKLACSRSGGECLMCQ